MSRNDLRAYLSLAAILAVQTASAASAETLPIKKISVDASKQLVVEFGGTAGNFPSAPHVLDLPGPNHRVVLDFTDAIIDKTSLPSADELSAAVIQSLPFVKSVRYSNLENAPAPTARIVLDVPEDGKFKPRVVKLEEGVITISLGEDLPATTSSAPVVTPIADAVPTPIGDATTAAQAQPVMDNTPVSSTNTAGAAPGWDWSANQNSAASADAPVLKPALATDTTPTEIAAAPSDSSTSPMGLAPDSAPTPAAAAPISEVTAEAVPPSAEAPVAPVTESVAETSTAPVEAAPVAEGDKKLLSVKRYNAAVQFHLQGKLQEAIVEYKSALVANSGLAEAHSNLGLIYNQQHNYAQALAEFRKALAINPKDAITYNGIGAALRAEKDLLGAIKNWQTAVALDSKLATAHYNLGTAYEIQKEYDKALTSYSSAVKNDYRLGEAYYRMGLIMERKRRPDDAAEQFQEALKVSGDSEYSEDARQRLAFLTQSKKGKTK